MSLLETRSPTVASLKECVALLAVLNGHAAQAARLRAMTTEDIARAMLSATKNVAPTFANRLRTIHAKLQCTWPEVARRCRISESMIYQVLKGASGLSEKSEFRLASLEREVGLR